MSGCLGNTCEGKPILLALSHLRWDFVFQRPQHLLTRAAKTYQVVVFEEPVESEGATPALRTRTEADGLLVATPMLPPRMDAAASDAAQAMLLDDLLASLRGSLDLVWYYTPMAFAFARHLEPKTIVFDCMDQLSGFRGASPRLVLLERQMLREVDIVFAGGLSLARAQRRLHANVHLFPSSVDETHFRKARSGHALRPASTAGAPSDPPDQARIAGPRIGYFGVIDERIDYALLARIAELRPAWQFVMIGPTAKVDPASLPRRPNLHWLGMKTYAELPDYLAGWNAGMMPFALNEATRYISPTKTPEFLAAGIPLVSTAVSDVVDDWGRDNLVAIAAGADEMIKCLESLLAGGTPSWLAAVDQRIKRMSWDATWSRMQQVIADLAASPVPAAQVDIP